MIRFVPFIVLFLALAAGLHAQTPAPPSDTSDPRIVVLVPQDVSIDKSLRKEAAAKVAELKKLQADRIVEARRLVDSVRRDTALVRKLGLSPEEVEELAGELTSPTNLEFGHVVSSHATMFLWHDIAGYHYRNVRVAAHGEPTKLDSASIARIAAKYKAHFVVAFPSVKIALNRKKERVGTLRTQLYAAAGGRPLLDTTLTANDENQGFTYGCTDHRIECSIINCLSGTVPALIQSISMNTPKTIYAMQLGRLRSEVLLKDYYGRPCNLRILNLLPIDSTMPSLASVYACFANADTTQIVAVYAEPARARRLAEGTEYGDREVNVISDDFRDLDAASNTYAFFLTGAKVEGRWFFKKQQVTYFDADTPEEGRRQFFLQIQRHNFFRPYSTEASPEFWNSGLFARVTDVSADPQLADAGGDESTRQLIREMREGLAKRNAPYIGMFEFVAEQLRHERGEDAPRPRPRISDDTSDSDDAP